MQAGSLLHLGSSSGDDLLIYSRKGRPGAQVCKPQESLSLPGRARPGAFRTAFWKGCTVSMCLSTVGPVPRLPSPPPAALHSPGPSPGRWVAVGLPGWQLGILKPEWGGVPHSDRETLQAFPSPAGSRGPGLGG